MCGIVGYVGKKAQAGAVLLDGLHRLEYRGYDSAGMCLIAKCKARTFRAVGKVAALEDKIGDTVPAATLGIAHTRWATHGKPSVANAHPHSSGKVHIVHNGIIENYQQLKDALIKKGYVFRSETDTEVVAHLIHEESTRHDFAEAVYCALRQLRGAYALAIVHTDHPDTLIAVRNSSPLVVGIAQNAYVVASDAAAIVAYTDRVVYPDDGEVVTCTPQGHTITTLRGRARRKEEHVIDWTEGQAQKGGYAHFMVKEIFEQPHALEDAIRGRTVLKEGMVRLGGLSNVEKRLRSIDRIMILSCGTSYNAGLVGKYMLEEYAGMHTDVEIASEFRYRKAPLGKNTAILAISQSGETADTLAAIREAKTKGIMTLGIVNVVGSSIARETDAGIYTHAGPEIGVASTKAFTAQLAVLALLTVYLGRSREMSLTMGKRILSELRALPMKMQEIFDDAPKIKRLAKKYASSSNMYYLGRKYHYPIAVEGALKIKEISYIHAEGYPAGELKHGPIALIDKAFPSVMIASRDSVFDKMASAIAEVHARDGKVIVVTTADGVDALKKNVTDTIVVPKTIEMLMPILTTIPMQLLAYYVGVAKGYDVDKPRNLAKSVTVE